MIKAWRNLSILPTCGTKFYQYGTDWKKIYSERFHCRRKKEKLSVHLKRHSKHLDSRLKSYGERKLKTAGSQITFSALGQEAPK